MFYFASDIHLGAGDRETARRTERRFLQWLTEIEPTAEALFLVGDVFDFGLSTEGLCQRARCVCWVAWQR